MWSIYVVPNNGTACLVWEEQYHTCKREKEKCAAGGGGIMPKTFEARLRPVMSVIE